MDYHELLIKTLNESKLTDAEIQRRCESNGCPFAPNYISTLRKEADRTASDEISRAIAKACGKYEDLLVFQKYFDKAPEAFRDVIENLRSTLIDAMIILTNSGDNINRIETIKNELNKLPIAELIASTSNVDREKTHDTISATSQTEMLNAYQEGYPVQDDAMEPIIRKDADVFTWAYDDWTEYKDGDIFCYHKVGDEAFYVREVQFLNDEHTQFRTLPRSTSYPKETFTKDDIFLYGKVTGMYFNFY